MLSIILGCKDADTFLTGKQFVNYNDGLFDDEYTEEWFEDPFIRRVMNDIDHIDLSKSSAVSFKNSITGDIHSHKELSTGCKTLILIYKYPNVIFQARFGDNCTDLLEEIAANKDITIKSDYIHSFNFKHIKEINYLNYNLRAVSLKDINKLISIFRDDNMLDIESDSEDECETFEDIKRKHPRFALEIEEALNEGDKR